MPGAPHPPRFFVSVVSIGVTRGYPISAGHIGLSKTVASGEVRPLDNSNFQRAAGTKPVAVQAAIVKVIVDHTIIYKSSEFGTRYTGERLKHPALTIW